MASKGKRLRSVSRAKLPAQRVMVGTRLTPEAKRRLDEAAGASGRSQAQEIELRLERSFDREDLLSEALGLAYGERVAAIVLLVAGAMSHTAAMADSRDMGTTASWLDDAYAFDLVAQEAMAVIDALRPEGDPTPPPTRDMEDLSTLKMRARAHEVLKAVAGVGDERLSAAHRRIRNDLHKKAYKHDPEQVRAMLGDDLLERIRKARR